MSKLKGLVTINDVTHGIEPSHQLGYRPRYLTGYDPVYGVRLTDLHNIFVIDHTGIIGAPPTSGKLDFASLYDEMLSSYTLEGATLVPKEEHATLLKKKR